jgi:hypothetical protein
VSLFLKNADQRATGSVPRPVLALLVLALCAHAAWQALLPRPVARAVALPAPAPVRVLRAASLGEPIAAAQLLTLGLQAWDNQPGISIPFRDLDYSRIAAWLDALLGLDPASHYPLLMATQLYARVPDAARQRFMLDFVHRKFLEDPDRRWRWLAHCAIVARHRLNDEALALRYAEDIARHARGAPGWARQMRIFLLADMGELQRATILLGGLLASGEVTDPNEFRFLNQRLEELRNAEISSSPPNY